MNIDRPHDIKEFQSPAKKLLDDIAGPPRHVSYDQYHAKKLRQRARYVPLTPEDEAVLRPMTEAERGMWLLEHMPTKERLARFLEAEGAPDWIVANARRGLYSDFESSEATPKVLLVTHLRQQACPHFANLVIEGCFDDTKEEAEAWAAKSKAVEALVSGTEQQEAQP